MQTPPKATPPHENIESGKGALDDECAMFVPTGTTAGNYFFGAFFFYALGLFSLYLEEHYLLSLICLLIGSSAQLFGLYLRRRQKLVTSSSPTN